MTYIDLLKHIMAKRNLARVELAFILKIPYKNFLKVLNGEKNLTKKQLKLLSVFSGIPVESIINGNFVLSDYNEQNTNGFLNGFNPAIPGITPEFSMIQQFRAEEETKQRRFAHFVDFTKKRFFADFASLPFVSLINGIFIPLSFILFIVLTFSLCVVNPSISTILLAIICYLPIIMCGIFNIKIHRIVKKFSFEESYELRKYCKYIIIAFLISNLLGLLCGYCSFPVFILNSLFMIYPAIEMTTDYRVVNTLKKAIKREVLYALSFGLVFLSSIIFGNEISSGSVINLHIIFIFSRLFFVFHFICTYQELSVFNTCSAWKNCFGELPEKNVLKKKHFLKSIIAVILICCLAITSVHIVYVSIYSALTKVVSTEYTYTEKEYYDKENVTFTKTDKTQELQQEEYSVKIPAEFLPDTENKVTQSYLYEDKKIFFTYNEQNNSVEGNPFSFGSYDYGEDDSSIFKAAKDTFLQAEKYIENKYGFYPENQLEYYKLEKLLYEAEPNYLSKMDIFVRQYTSIYFAVASPIYDSILLYEDEETAGVLFLHSIDTEDGSDKYIYIYQFGPKDEPFFEHTIVVHSSESDDEMIYKVINSIDFNEK